MAVAVALLCLPHLRHRNVVIHDESCAHLDGLVHVILTDVYRGMPRVLVWFCFGHGWSLFDHVNSTVSVCSSVIWLVKGQQQMFWAALVQGGFATVGR
nr:hypothetical protein Iba_chr15aCG8830 [Ipomoea batatas]